MLTENKVEHGYLNVTKGGLDKTMFTQVQLIQIATVGCVKTNSVFFRICGKFMEVCY